MKHKTLFRIMALLIVALLVILVIFNYWVSGWIDTPSCGQKEVISKMSPNGELVATVFKGSCGATTGLFTKAHVTRALHKFKYDRRGLTDDGLICESGGDIEINPEWESNNSLILHLSKKDSIDCKSHYEGIVISLRK
jgi:hypothetical protein